MPTAEFAPLSNFVIRVYTVPHETFVPEILSNVENMNDMVGKASALIGQQTLNLDISLLMLKSTARASTATSNSPLY